MRDPGMERVEREKRGHCGQLLLTMTFGQLILSVTYEADEAPLGRFMRRSRARLAERAQAICDAPYWLRGTFTYLLIQYREPTRTSHAEPSIQLDCDP
jgi:hypothetical protein